MIQTRWVTQKRAKLRTRTALLLAAMLGCVWILACSSTSTDTNNDMTSSPGDAGSASTDAVTSMPIPTTQPRPRFLIDVSPAESTSIPLSLFEQPDGWQGTRVSFPDPAYGYDSLICVMVDVGPPLWQPGDDFTEHDDLAVFERMALLVDEQILSEMAVKFAFIGLLERNSQAEPDKEKEDWIGPYTACWKAELDIGLHKATFQFRQTSGHVQEYSWHFALTEGE
jgi:hypothetical protein